MWSNIYSKWYGECTPRDAFGRKKSLIQSLNPMTPTQYNLSSISACSMTILVHSILVMVSPAVGIGLRSMFSVYEKPFLIIPSIVNKNIYIYMHFPLPQRFESLYISYSNANTCFDQIWLSYSLYLGQHLCKNR